MLLSIEALFENCWLNLPSSSDACVVITHYGHWGDLSKCEGKFSALGHAHWAFSFEIGFKKSKFSG